MKIKSSIIPAKFFPSSQYIPRSFSVLESRAGWSFIIRSCQFETRSACTLMFLCVTHRLDTNVSYTYILKSNIHGERVYHSSTLISAVPSTVDTRRPLYIKISTKSTLVEGHSTDSFRKSKPWVCFISRPLQPLCFVSWGFPFRIRLPW